MDDGFSRTPRDDTMTTYKAPAYPATAPEQIQYWTALRDHYARLCWHGIWEDKRPAQFGLWEAEVRRADMQIAMIRFPEHAHTAR